MKNFLQYSVLFYFCASYSQDSIASFSQTLKANTAKYVEKSNEAFAQNNLLEGQNLFNSLVNEKLIGTRFDNFTVKTLSSQKISIDKIKKPMLIITYASWCVINKGDIPALNQLAENHSRELQIMILFWGNKLESKKIAKLFHKNIQIAFANFGEKENYDFVSQLKNTLGFPTSYLIDSNKTVVNISRLNNPYLLNTSTEKALTDSYKHFNTIINEGIMNKTKSKNIVAN